MRAAEFRERLDKINGMLRQLTALEEHVAACAIAWACFGWLWLLGGRDELETWADAGDCCNDCDDGGAELMTVMVDELRQWGRTRIRCFIARSCLPRATAGGEG